ncbi:esterase/lipase/thioesterase domain-containing protein [Fusarium tricinctum]|jgi:pimeloyl-ACP methyl ester carboxylesterase|uniref:Esterase/lipase/thioesterase domain-containing protein n=1 Tax=Fusarium tricinctum TaxID=61284 RepID=A0A8K0RVT0_9HYPO|nr:esterase/lipase/thioesterase domain-containing protein [Fusarium tricinctum]
MIPARILLVHGALADGSSWSKVIPTLLDAGHNVTAVQQPLTSLPNDIATVKEAIHTLNEDNDVPIVVVGHSFGGFAITNAATDEPNIKSLVYVMAFAPDEGETVAELGKNYTTLESNLSFRNDTAGRLYLPPPAYLKYFAPDVHRDEARVLAATQGPFDPLRFGFPSGKPAWKQVKNKHYVVATKDQIIQPELEEFFAKRIGAKKHTLRGASHAGLWSRGEDVADIILEAARGL